MTDDVRTGWELVVFDCDGVLVDSERISNRVMTRMLNSLGLAYTHEETVDRFLGRSMPSCMKIIEESLGEPAPADFLDEFERETFRAFEAELEPVPGVVEILDWLPWPSCVASSGDHAKLRTTLTRTGLFPRFEGRIFSATEVAHGKPHPDLFLHAAGRMGADPARTAVVEDSVLGVQAGLAAGMRVFGYGGTVGAERLQAAGAHRVFTEMRELPRLLQEDAP